VKIFVHEYICGGGLAGQALPESLAAEGRAMWTAALEDFAALPGAEVHTLADRRFDVTVPGVHAQPVGPGDEPAAFGELAAACDFTLVIAPEFDGLLEARCRRALAAGGHLLGPSAEAVAVAADKPTLDGRLLAAGLPTPWGQWLRRQGDHMSAEPFPAVLKPARGAGSQGVFLVADRAGLAAATEAAVSEGVRESVYLQPHIPGRPASIALLVGPEAVAPLMPAFQHLSDDGRFRYLGGSAPPPPELFERAVDLGRRAVAAVPGLRGYVGVDLILGETADADVVIEINPRLTTSYVGLRVLSEVNLAGQMLNAVLGRPIALRWKAGGVAWTAGGHVEYAE
jgi:predicted ATP-grasp superfamily ATP-dependent carboligase